MAVSMFSLLLRTLLILISAICFTHCHGTEQFANRFVFSDKSAYNFLKKSIPKRRNYDPVFINMVIRHGSRYPSKPRVTRMSKIMETLNVFFPVNATFRYKGLSLPWNIPADVRNAAHKELSELGAQEMYMIAKRMRAKFPDLFKHGYSNTKYSFVATDKLRSSQSAVAFAQGIFERQGTVGLARYMPVAVQFSGPADKDRVLRIHEACPKWKKVRKEYDKFMNGPHVRNVTENIYNILNLKNKTKLLPQTIVEMWLSCAYGTQTDSNDMSLCYLFGDEDLEVMEYLNDLRIYWSYSYGRKINSKMACLLYTKITESFQQYIQTGNPYGVFQFAHTGTFLPLLTLLKLYKVDLPLRADNFEQQKNRTFRPSNIVPMSANVAFILYDRSMNGANSSSGKGTSLKRDASEIIIQVLVNEVAVEIPACKGQTYCVLKKFLSHYSYIGKGCNINKICGRLKRNCRKPNRKGK